MPASSVASVSAASASSQLSVPPPCDEQVKSDAGELVRRGGAQWCPRCSQRRLHQCNLDGVAVHQSTFVDFSQTLPGVAIRMSPTASVEGRLGQGSRIHEHRFCLDRRLANLLCWTILRAGPGSVCLSWSFALLSAVRDSSHAMWRAWHVRCRRARSAASLVAVSPFLRCDPASDQFRRKLQTLQYHRYLVVFRIRTDFCRLDASIACAIG